MASPLMLILFLWSTLAFATCAGLHMELTHVDAKANYTMAERLRRAADRSRRRLATQDDMSAPVHWATNQYIAQYSIGNPPQRAEALIDTGSDIIWTQCAGCAHCVRQNLPLYNASRSNSVDTVPCNGTMCLATPKHTCTKGGGCFFTASYGAGDIFGHLGTATFKFAPAKVTLDFGCVVETRLHDPGSLSGASGLIGLGRGALSLVSQIGGSNGTKFSYCLTPYFQDTKTLSHLFVGPSATLSSTGPIMSMTFAKNPIDEPFNTFYYLPLMGITVGNTMLPIPSTLFDLRQVAPRIWVGGVIIDSGSPFTNLVDVAYRALRSELARQLGPSLVPPPAELGVDLCVARSNATSVPPLVFHFPGGADMAVPVDNYWAPVDESTACMVVFNSAHPNATLPMNETSMIGNFHQQNMHLLYDLDTGVLSFQPADCSAL